MFAFWQISMQRQWNCHHSSAHCCDHACEFGIFMGTCQHLIACPDDLPDTFAKIDDFVNSLATENIITVHCIHFSHSFGRENIIVWTVQSLFCKLLYQSPRIAYERIPPPCHCERTKWKSSPTPAQSWESKRWNGEQSCRRYGGVERDSLFVQSGCRERRFWATINEIITSTATCFQIHPQSDPWYAIASWHKHCLQLVDGERWMQKILFSICDWVMQSWVKIV